MKLKDLREKRFTPKEIKMAIGIATDKRYKGGNMTGASQAIEKIKKGLSDHPQVKAVLKRVNEYGGPQISRSDYLKKGKEYHSKQSQSEAVSPAQQAAIAISKKEKEQKECASEDDFKPHMMYDPKTGKGVKANTYADHVKYDKMGYTHEKPEVNEAIDFFKTSKALSDYAKKSGGIDKRDFEKAAAYVREIGKNSSTMVQNKAFMGLKKHVSNMDTDPRDGVLSILKKHGMFKNGRLMQEQAENCGCGKTPCETYGIVEKKAGHIDQLRDIVKNKQAKKVNGVMVDMFTASAITQIYDKVNDQNKKRMDGMTIPALADVAYKMMKKR